MYWIQSLRQNSLVPRIMLLQDVPNDQWATAERYWIAYYRSLGCPLTNGTDGGEGKLGHPTSVATRAKLSAATKRQFSEPEARAAVVLPL
jgi:hypothetical protein